MKIKFLIALLLLSLTLLRIPALGKIMKSTAPDFSVLYMGAMDLKLGKNPYINPGLYTGIGYPPQSLVFYFPLTFLDYQIAQNIFTLISILSGVLTVLLGLILVKKFSISNFSIFSCLLFFAFPSQFTLGMGQVNLISGFLLLLSFYCIQKNMQSIAGIAMALAMISKPIFGVFLIYFLLQKRRMFLAWTICTYAFFLLGVRNPLLIDYWLGTVVPQLLNLDGREIYFNQGLLGFAARFIHDLSVRHLVELISLAGFGVMLIGLSKKVRDENLLFSIWIVSLLLVDTLSWQHHFVWLIFPFIVVYAKKLAGRSKLFLILVFISYLFVATNIKYPDKYNVLFQSNNFYGAVMLLFLLLYQVTEKTHMKLKLPANKVPKDSKDY